MMLTAKKGSCSIKTLLKIGPKLVPKGVYSIERKLIRKTKTMKMKNYDEGFKNSIYYVEV